MIPFLLQRRQPCSRRLPPPETSSGFTLVELLIVIAIVAILAALTAPTFENMSRKMALTGAASELASGLQFARSEALRSGKALVFELKTDNSWRIFQDANSNKTYDAGDTLLRENTISTRIAQIPPTAAAIQITYTAGGTAAYTPSTYEQCEKNKSVCICLRIKDHLDFEPRLVRVNNLGRPSVLGEMSKDQAAGATSANVKQVCANGGA
jgi:type II secretion system protein H